MPLLDTCHRLPISSITVLRDERQRRQIETKDLELSIAQLGLLQPIIVERATRTHMDNPAELWTGELWVLVAGERRLQACKNLGHTDILARFAHELSPTESSIIELEENIKRSDLEWQDMVRAIQRIHQLYTQLDPEWTMAETARQVSLNPSTVSLYLSVARHLDEPRIAEASTVREAYNTLERREARNQDHALDELLGMAHYEITGHETINLPEGPKNVIARLEPSISDTILNTSFLSWAPTYTGPKFNLIHCDFPYGIDPFFGQQGRGSEPSPYDDTPDRYFALLDCLLDNLPRLMSISAHIVFWFSHKNLDDTLSKFRYKAPGLRFYPFPLIWVKSDNAGIAADPRHGPRHVYETALLATAGERNIVRVVSDAYSCPTDKRLHPSCKPEPMLHHFFEMLVDEHTLLLDPTCGSGSALRAAERLNARHVLGLEQDWQFCESARRVLRDARTLAKLARS